MGWPEGVSRTETTSLEPHGAAAVLRTWGLVHHVTPLLAQLYHFQRTRLAWSITYRCASYTDPHLKAVTFQPV